MAINTERELKEWRIMNIKMEGDTGRFRFL
jgi:hypothetical protein